VNRRLFIISCVLLVLAGGSILLGFVMSLEAVTLQQVRLPPAATVQVDQPGTWLLWQVAPAVAPSTPRMSLKELPRLTGPTGMIVEAAPTIRTIRFTEGDETFVVVGRYEVDTRGGWRMGAGGIEGTGARDWAIGLDPLPMVKLWSLLTVSVAIVLVGAAACTGWIALRRSPNRGLPPVSGPSRG